ncbi:SSI family serine proteinase inhibitor [Arthrobacter sp. TMT4-20]
MIREHQPRHQLSRVNLLLGAGVLLLAFAGCGAESGGPATGSTSTAPTPDATAGTPEASASPGDEATADSQLTVIVSAGDDVEPVTYELACAAGAPVGESALPDPAAACAVLAAHGDLIKTEPDPDAMCTMQYGGPETAVVTGTLDGEQIDASFSRENGCEIDRWSMFEPLLGTPGGTGAL